MASHKAVTRPIKAVILAAGAKSITEDGLPVVLQELAGKKIIDYAVANAAQVVGPADTYVVVGYGRDAIEAHLGPDYHYATQGLPRAQATRCANSSRCCGILTATC